MNKYVIHILMVLFSAFFIHADMPLPPIVILAPFASDSLSYDQGKIFIVSVSKNLGSQLLFSTQWSALKMFDLSEAGLKNSFAKDFFKLIPPQATFEQMTYSFEQFNGNTAPETLSFLYRDTATIRRLWQHPKFIQLAKDIQKTNASRLLVSLQGWTDTSYEATYDDPNNDNRTLYKMHAQLLPGKNKIYCSAVGNKNEALLYQTNFIMDAKPTADRSERFHGSGMEQSCSTCHEHLPGIEATSTLKADCNVCHKAMTSGLHLHAPAEMKECVTCHTWSDKNHAVVVDQGVPTTCYTCHADKQAQVENSPTIHPVAGECLTCHSPHGTQQKHIVKENIYPLCTTCHEDQQANHPVGRHPLRFMKVKQTGEELSCVTCHNPHGSPNQHLLTVAGGPMEVCAKCH